MNVHNNSKDRIKNNKNKKDILDLDYVERWKRQAKRDEELYWRRKFREQINI